MSDNVAMMREAYEKFGSGDPTFVDAWSDDIRWDGPNAPEVPGGGRT